MNNIKLFMLLIMAATSSVAIADDNTWEFDSTTEPGTLIIKGKGDLTTADQSTDYDVFTSAAVGYVFTDNTGTSVTDGVTYDPETTYYKAVSSWTQLFDGGVPTTDGNYVRNISTNNAWKTDAVGENDVYLYPAYMSTNQTMVWKKNNYYIYKLQSTQSQYVNDGKVKVIGSELTGSTRDDWNSTYSYDGTNNYINYIASSSQLSDGQEVDVNNVTLLSEGNYSDYIKTYYPIVISDTHVSSSTVYPDWIGTYTYGDVTYIQYVVYTSALASGTNLDPDDPNLTKLTSLDDYTSSTTTYYVNTANVLYISTDNGDNKTLLPADGTQRTYHSGETFWTPSETTYSPIEDNTTYFGTTHPTYLGVATENLTFKEALLAEMKANESNYTKVAFDNTGSGELTIDKEIIQAILYPNAENQVANNTIVTLDLGKATNKSVTDYSYLFGYEVYVFDDDLIPHPDVSGKTPTNLTNLTLPLVKKVNEEMVLPTIDTPVGTITTITVPQGYTKIGYHGLTFYTDAVHINLPEGLKEIGNGAMKLNNLEEINITDAEVAGRKIVLPSSVEVIREAAFRSCQKLVSTESDPFILPKSLVKIEDQAFVDCQKLAFLEFNEGLTYIGNSAFALQSESHAQTAITFPSTIEYLGPASFHFRQYQDIYFTSQTAPVCPIGLSSFQSDWGNVSAFDISIQNGNNGFNPLGISSDGNSSTSVEGFADNAFSGYANRENYINNGYYLTLLHFPENLSSDQAETFRDITRRYVTGVFDENGNFDYAGYGGHSSHGVFCDQIDPDTGESYGSVFEENETLSYGGVTCYCTSTNVQPGFIDTYLGAQAVWPSQAQWMRNFITVANGLKWDGETEYLPELTEDMFNNMKADGLVVNGTDDDTAINLANKVWSDPGEDESVLTEAEKKYLSKILYQGTRRFVLSYDSPFPVPFKQEMETGKWYSFCVPFNMTKKEVDDIFGVGTHVCLFSGVERTIDAVNGNKLVLKFKNDVYRHVTERSIASGDHGGFTYTYEKNFSKENLEAVGDETVVYARQSYMIFPMEDADDPAENDDVRAKIRNFGSPNFETGDPLPTIVYSNSSAPYTTQNGTDPAYRFIGNFTTTAGYETNDNVTTAVSVKIPKYSYAYGKMGGQRKFFILNTDKAAWSPFKSIVQNTAVGGGADDWNNFFQQNTARVNQVSLFGDDEEVTGIDNVIIEVSSDNDEDLRVFNLNGSMMGNSLQGLPAGTYIQGGKAYRVK